LLLVQVAPEVLAQQHYRVQLLTVVVVVIQHLVQVQHCSPHMVEVVGLGVFLILTIVLVVVLVVEQEVRERLVFRVLQQHL
jgi:hypothetical protein